MWLLLKKYAKHFLYLLFFSFACLLIIELSFRYQVIDFYKSELKGLNTPEQLNNKKNNILIFGDSFSAHPFSYVQFLDSSYNYVNCAIPGTGIKQHSLIIPKRIKQYQPKAIIYQFYVGNDLLDIKHPINYSELSFLRNVYWWLSEHFLFLQYINYKLAYLNPKNQSFIELKENVFSKKSYNQRVKTYFKASPFYLNHTILLNDEATRLIYAEWKDHFRELFNNNIPIYLLVIPHNAQINKTYYERNVSIGAILSDSIQKENYPLIEKMKKDLPYIKIINPLPYFQHLENNDSLYYENDPHLTLWGQKKLALFVNKELKKQ